jgi:hypothetical protein
MTKIYLTLGLFGLILIAYIIGATHGRANCLQDIATKTKETFQQQSTKREKINAEIYRTGVNNIRNILRTKYTITD